MPLAKEEKARRRAQNALESGKQHHACGEVNKALLEEVRAEVAARRKAVQTAASASRERVREAGDEQVRRVEQAGEQVMRKIRAEAAAVASATSAAELDQDEDEEEEEEEEAEEDGVVEPPLLEALEPPLVEGGDELPLVAQAAEGQQAHLATGGRAEEKSQRLQKNRLQAAGAFCEHGGGGRPQPFCQRAALR